MLCNYSCQILNWIIQRLLNYLHHCLTDETEYDWSLSEEEDDEAPEAEGEPRYCNALFAIIAKPNDPSVLFIFSPSHYGAYDAQVKSLGMSAPINPLNGLNQCVEVRHQHRSLV